VEGREVCALSESFFALGFAEKYKMAQTGIWLWELATWWINL